jgi:hypothetical protein
MEKLTERKLKDEVEKLGGLCIKFFCPTFTGLPDRIVLLPGAKIGFVEVKDAGKKPNGRQAYVHELLKRLGFKVYVLDLPQQITQILKAIQS